jgi:hypothetical protein
VGETIGEANMNPTNSLLDVENVHLPFGSNLSIKNDYVQLVVIKVQIKPYGNHTTKYQCVGVFLLLMTTC